MTTFFLSGRMFERAGAIARYAAAAALISSVLSAPVQAQVASGRMTNDQTHSLQGWMNEPRLFAQSIDLLGKPRTGNGPPDGFYPEFGSMPTGAGWISAGPGFRQHLFGRSLLIDGSAAISRRTYKTAQVRLEWRRAGLVLGGQTLWQDLTQVSYFGLGPRSPIADRSEYRLRGADSTAFAALNLTDGVTLAAGGGWLGVPRFSTAVGPGDVGSPSTFDLFGDAGAPGLAQRPSFVHVGAGIFVDRRDRPNYARRGWAARAQWTDFVDRASAGYGFERYQVDALGFVPLAGEQWVLAVKGSAAVSASAAGQTVPFYLMPDLGDDNGLRGYPGSRFRDRDAVLVSAESRWAIFPHIDAALFLDAGDVAARVRALDLRNVTIGGGIRLHSRTATVGRLDVGHGREGWRVTVALDDMLALHESITRALAAPFVK